MNRNAYGFTVDRTKSLASEAFRAVSRIYGAGIMLHEGRVVPGGNNVMADAAAQAFESKDIVALHASADPQQKLAAEIISLRQEFADLSAAREARRGQPVSSAVVQGQAQQQSELLQKIYNKAQDLEKLGWQPDMKPHTLPNGPRPV